MSSLRRTARAQAFEEHKQERRAWQQDMLMQDQRMRVQQQQGFEQLARTGTFADARVEVSFQLARSGQAIPGRLVGMFGMWVASLAAVLVDWHIFAGSQPVTAEEAAANGALRRQAGIYSLLAASSDTARVATGDGGGFWKHPWGQAYLAAVVAVAVMGLQLLVTMLVTFRPLGLCAWRLRLPCRSPVADAEWQPGKQRGESAAASAPAGTAAPAESLMRSTAAEPLTFLSAGTGVGSGGLTSLSTRRGWGVVLSRDVPSMAFSMACYVCWFGAVRFMDETDTVVQGRGWIASFNLQLPKFYFLLLSNNVLLQLPPAMAWLVLIFQFVVFIVTDAITPNFAYSLQVGCVGTPMRKDFYFSIIFPVVSGMLQAYSRNTIQRQCFRMQTCAHILLTRMCRIAEHLMPAHVIQRIQTARAGQAHAPQRATGDHGKIETTFAETRTHVLQMFADMQGFTEMAASLDAEDTFLLLSQMWDLMDAQCQRNGVTKVETIGDAYWCAMGVDQDAKPSDAQTLLGMALHLQKQLKSGILFRANGTRMPVRLRVAVHFGPVVEGLVGWKMPRYQLFGPSVNKTTALEQIGSTCGVVMSRAFSDFLHLGLSDLPPAAHSPRGIPPAVLHDLQPVGLGEASALPCSESRTPVSAESLSPLGQRLRRAVSADSLVSEVTVPLVTSTTPRTPVCAKPLESAGTVARAPAALLGGQGSSSTLASLCSQGSAFAGSWTGEESEVGQQDLLPQCLVQVLTGMQVAVVNYTPQEVQWRALIETLDVLAGLGPRASNAETKANLATQHADPAMTCTAPAVLSSGRHAPWSEVTKCDDDPDAAEISNEEEGDGKDEVHDDDEELNSSPVNDPEARASERRERELVRVTACCMYALALARSLFFA